MNKILQITAGRGPAECSWVVAKVLKLLIEELLVNGFDYSILHKVKGVENTTLNSVTILVEGTEKQLIHFSKNWVGTIQWVGQSTFRKYHKRKNWFIAINELDLAGASFEISDRDIRYEATKSGGPGGQHVNKVSSAIRAVHKPTGIFVKVSDSRSQHQNKKMAKERLVQLLKIREIEDQKAAIQSNWQNHNELQRGNPVRVFKGADFKSSYQSKNYKSKRQKHKLELKKLNFKD